MKQYLIVGGAIAAVVGLLLFGYGCYQHGRDVENQAWEVVVGKQKTEAANVLADATSRVLAAERAEATANLKLEAEHAKDVADANDRDRGLRTDLERVRAEERKRCGRGGGIPAGQAPGAGGDRDHAPGGDTGLASRIEDANRRIDVFTSDAARGAAVLASVVRTCNVWALTP